MYCSRENNRISYTMMQKGLWINKICHHVARGTRESHPSVHDLQSMTRLAESLMLQILDTRIRFLSLSHNVVIDNFSLTLKMYWKSNKQCWFPSSSRHIGIDFLWRHYSVCVISVVDSKTCSLQLRSGVPSRQVKKVSLDDYI